MLNIDVREIMLDEHFIKLTKEYKNSNDYQ